MNTNYHVIIQCFKKQIVHVDNYVKNIRFSDAIVIVSICAILSSVSSGSGHITCSYVSSNMNRVLQATIAQRDVD